MGVIEAIAAGLLVPLVTKSPRQAASTRPGWRSSAASFSSAPSSRPRCPAPSPATPSPHTQVADEENRQSLLFFAIGVAHCAAISEELRERGIDHAVITGETPTDERADAIARFRPGELRALVNCNVLTTGFDARNIDCIAFMRPTVSPVLWTQAAGRGMRTWPGKSDCRLLDFGGNILRHGPINAIKLRPQGARHDAQAAADRVRICPRCDEINEITTAVCTSCGMVLIKPRVSVIESVESTAPAIDASADHPRWVRVHAMRGGIHEKPGRPPSFRLRYSTEEGWVSEFLALEHEKSGARWYAGRRGRGCRARQASLHRPLLAMPIGASSAASCVSHSGCGSSAMASGGASSTSREQRRDRPAMTDGRARSVSPRRRAAVLGGLALR